jgi:hypothetical protein
MTFPRFSAILFVILRPGRPTVVGIKASVEASATDSFAGQASVTVKTKMEVIMVSGRVVLASTAGLGGLAAKFGDQRPAAFDG